MQRVSDEMQWEADGLQRDPSNQQRETLRMRAVLDNLQFYPKRVQRECYEILRDRSNQQREADNC